MKKKVSLVLSSGGARGLAHIGIIEELEKEDFEITSIAGSSVGALVGGIYANGNLQGFTDWIMEFGKMDVLRMMDFALSKRGFIKGEKVFKHIKKFIGDSNIEDLPIPFAAIAADIHKHQEVVFTSGSLSDAIRASVSIPTIFFPMAINGSDLIDGGMINPLPLNRVKRTGDDILIAVNLNAAIPYEGQKLSKEIIDKESYFFKAKENIDKWWGKFFKKQNNKNKKLGFYDMLVGSFALMQDQLSYIAIEANKPDILINISRDACDTLEFYKGNEMISYGRKAFRQALDEYKKTRQ